MQVPQNPLPSHTWFDPHDVPADTLPGPSTHAEAPLAHEMMPLLHGDGLPLQPLPAVHDTQMPALLQTMLVPQLVPFGMFSDSTQTGAPVLQVVVP